MFYIISYGDCMVIALLKDVLMVSPSGRVTVI